jgi:hypothetical protein
MGNLALCSVKAQAVQAWIPTQFAQTKLLVCTYINKNTHMYIHDRGQQLRSALNIPLILLFIRPKHVSVSSARGSWKNLGPDM